MSGLFQKFASAFVEIEPDPTADGEVPADRNVPSLDDITQDASDLLAQLDGMTMKRGRAGEMPGTQIKPPKGEESRSNAEVSGSASKLDMTAQSVFQQSGIVDGPNSAERIIKLISGLAMFPTEQQVVMVRAMDAADNSWSEEEVLEDARKRQAVLRRHLQEIQAEREQRLASLDQRIEETRAKGQETIGDIDRQIADLQKQREEAVIDITATVGKFEQQKEELQRRAEEARRGITSVVNAFSNLMSFFVGNKVGGEY